MGLSPKDQGWLAFSVSTKTQTPVMMQSIPKPTCDIRTISLKLDISRLLDFPNAQTSLLPLPMGVQVNRNGALCFFLIALKRPR